MSDPQQHPGRLDEAVKKRRERRERGKREGERGSKGETQGLGHKNPRIWTGEAKSAGGGRERCAYVYPQAFPPKMQAAGL